MVEEVEMDKPREGVARQKKIRRTIYAVVGLLGIAGVTFALSRLEPAAPSVKRATVWMDIVKRGSMLRQVRGPGTLEPEEIRWIASRTAGRVEQVVILPGTIVKSDSVIIEMSLSAPTSLPDAKANMSPTTWSASRTFMRMISTRVSSIE